MPQDYAEQRFIYGPGKEFSAFTHCNGEPLNEDDIAYLKLLLKNTEATLGKIRWTNPLLDEPPVRETKVNKPTRIYLMQNRANGLWKIGHSQTPRFREKTLQSQEPDIHLLCDYPGTIQIERNLHAMFGHKRRRGEWFDLDNEDVAAIRTHLAKSPEHT